ncbi:MAG: preprotein translocase subunit SecE [Candidatus Tantalella remota]|nr:preprotein translocase subunit SecE [Candidatus Tantalella remota]
MLKIGKFVGQVKSEMKKVAWPSRQELMTSTMVVLVSTLMLAVFIGLCDLVLSRVVNFLIRGAF